MEIAEAGETHAFSYVLLNPFPPIFGGCSGVLFCQRNGAESLL